MDFCISSDNGIICFKQFMKFPKPKKFKKTDLRRAKDRAWAQFSLYIRLKDSVDGVNECYTCGKIFNYKELSAGHGIGGRNNKVLFDEAIVRPQCSGCNIWGRGQYQVFTRKLIGELGLDNYDEIVQHSSDPVKYRVGDYQSIEEMYKRKVEQL